MLFVHFLAFTLYRRGYVVNTTSPYGGATENIKLQIFTPRSGYHALTTRIGVDTSTGATPAPHQSGPNESSACSRASSDDHLAFSRDHFAYVVTGTGTTGTTSGILYSS